MGWVFSRAVRSLVKVELFFNVCRLVCVQRFVKVKLLCLAACLHVQRWSHAVWVHVYCFAVEWLCLCVCVSSCEVGSGQD